jgi:hypothetical protein
MPCGQAVSAYGAGRLGIRVVERRLLLRATVIPRPTGRAIIAAVHAVATVRPFERRSQIRQVPKS